MNQEFYQEEMMVKEAITSQKSDQEIGMPDIEAELRRVKKIAKPRITLWNYWHRAAAVMALVLAISGLSWAVVYYQQAQLPEADQQEVVSEPVYTKQVTEEAVVKPSEQLTLSYNKATLQQIVVDLSAFYHLEEPVFENKEARNLLLHVTLSKEATLQESIELLNHFGNIRIELADNKIVVK